MHDVVLHKVHREHNDNVSHSQLHLLVTECRLCGNFQRTRRPKGVFRVNEFYFWGKVRTTQNGKELKAPSANCVTRVMDVVWVWRRWCGFGGGGVGGVNNYWSRYGNLLFGRR